MNKLIEKIEGTIFEYFKATSRDGPRWKPTEFHEGMDEATDIIVDILKTYPVLMLEKIDVEEAQASDEVLALCSGYFKIINWNCFQLSWGDEATGEIVEPSAFYRLP